VKFVHAADLHIDSPMKGLSAYAGAPLDPMRGATRRAFESLVELCVEEEADLLVIAGDVYDGDWKDFSTGLYLRSQLARVREEGVEVAIVHGNHDAASAITRSLRLPGVYVLPSDEPDSVVLEDIGAVVHGQSFATPAVTENLAAGYPAALSGFFNIGLLHTGLRGNVSTLAKHEPYAPCCLEELVNRGYDYWALGHVHERLALHADPHVVFSGNLQGRHINECGAKGATVVEVLDGDATLVHRELDHVRWMRVLVDAGGAEDEVEVLERAQAALRSAVEAVGSRLLACRIEVEGSTRAHELVSRERERMDSELRGLAIDLGGERIWVERIVWSTMAPGSMAGEDDAVGETLSVLHGVADSPEALEALADGLRPLAVRLPAEVREGPDGIDPTDSQTLTRLLGEVERTLPGLIAGERTP
jgi:DNA repair exonuclease SbcCD nuclease subunit